MSDIRSNDFYKHVFVIIPCYNEEWEVVKRTIDSVLSFGYQLILIDDGSDLSPPQAIMNLPIYYLRHAVNLGQGAALQTGMSLALQKGARYVVHFDADGQHQAKDISRLLQPLLADQYDISIGTRFSFLPARAMPLKRYYLLKIGILVQWFYAGLWLTDSHNGFRAMNAKALQAIRITENRMAHATEILRIVKQRKLRLIEVPVEILYDAYSLGKGSRLFQAIEIFFDLFLKK